MNDRKLLRILVVLILASLACSLVTSRDVLPPTSTPERIRFDDEDAENIDFGDEDNENVDDEDNENVDDEDNENVDDEDNENVDDEDNENVDDEDNENVDDEDNENVDDENNENADEEEDQGGASGGCDIMQASSDEVIWVTLTEDFDIDEEVDSYPSGTNLITPIFEYDCVPQRVEIVTIFSLDGEVVYSDQESLRPSTAEGYYGYPLGTTDGSPIDEGEWSVEFYNDEELLASGAVLVGGSGGGEEEEESTVGNTVTVEGTVVDKSSGKPINGAAVLVLNPGVTVQDFIDNGYLQADVYTDAETNSRGQFTLPNPLERNVEYSVIVVAEGYQPIAVDGFVVDDEVPDPLVLDIQLAR